MVLFGWEVFFMLRKRVQNRMEFSLRKRWKWGQTRLYHEYPDVRYVLVRAWLPYVCVAFGRRVYEFGWR